MNRDQDSNAADLEVVSRVMQGDTEAFSLIVEKYQSVVIRLCRSYMKDDEEAEDAAQEIFLRAFRSLARFRLDKRLITWLYSIALNHLKSRCGRLRRIREQNTPLKSEPPSPHKAPEESHLLEELRRDIRQALTALPVNLREVTVLYYLEELSVTDIPEITGLGAENIKSRLFRARKKLRELLEKTQPPGENGGIHI